MARKIFERIAVVIFQFVIRIASINFTWIFVAFHQTLDFLLIFHRFCNNEITHFSSNILLFFQLARFHLSSFFITMQTCPKTVSCSRWLLSQNLTHLSTGLSIDNLTRISLLWRRQTFSQEINKNRFKIENKRKKFFFFFLWQIVKNDFSLRRQHNENTRADHWN